jgi:hypothetical protein
MINIVEISVAEVARTPRDDHFGSNYKANRRNVVAIDWVVDKETSLLSLSLFRFSLSLFLFSLSPLSSRSLSLSLSLLSRSVSLCLLSICTCVDTLGRGSAVCRSPKKCAHRMTQRHACGVCEDYETAPSNLRARMESIWQLRNEVKWSQDALDIAEGCLEDQIHSTIDSRKVAELRSLHDEKGGGELSALIGDIMNQNGMYDSDGELDWRGGGATTSGEDDK